MNKKEWSDFYNDRKSKEVHNEKRETIQNYFNQNFKIEVGEVDKQSEGTLLKVKVLKLCGMKSKGGKGRNR